MLTKTTFSRIHIHSVPQQHWKNGRGLTRELAHGTGWRISLAQVGEDCDFSLFAGYTRHSVVVAGNGVDLRCGPDHVALERGAVAVYDGGMSWQARLRDGPVQILNVMAQRGLAEADVRVLAAPARVRAGSGQPQFVLPLDAGATWLAPDAAAIELRAGEFLRYAAGAAREFGLAGAPGARVLVASIGGGISEVDAMDKPQ